MAIPLAAAIGVGLLKGGLSAFGESERRRAIKEQRKAQKDVIKDIEEQQAESAAKFGSRLNTILSRAAMERDPRKAGVFASMFAGTTQAREAERAALESQKRQIELQMPVTPKFNVLGVLSDIATGALTGAELGLNIEELGKDVQFRDRMREYFLSELDIGTSSPKVPSSTIVGAGLQANRGLGLRDLASPNPVVAPFLGRGFIEPF